MSTKKKASSTPKLKVVFDTSVLYTQVAYDFARKEIAQLIGANSKHPDLTIQWLVPKVVVDERRHQMRLKALDLFPSIEKLEKLLGHNLNITQDILFERIDHAIQNQLGKLSISEILLDTTTVDWNALIQRAVNRQPPFEGGGKEKGFRDSLIAESFLQIVSLSPVTPSVCRLAIISDDQLLRDYVTESTKAAKNVRVLSSTDE
ncbi:MAG: PIN domain-containing protein, partial [Acidobacteriaceae bacterium]